MCFCSERMRELSVVSRWVSFRYALLKSEMPLTGKAEGRLAGVVGDLELAVEAAEDQADRVSPDR